MHPRASICHELAGLSARVPTVTTRQRIIQIAKLGPLGQAEIPQVLSVATDTDGRHLLAVCLDCFRAVLQDSQTEITFEVVRFLGQLLRDPAYRRIRRRVVITATWIGRASSLILPELVDAFRKPSSKCALAPARSAVISVAWTALANGDPTEQAAAIQAFEQLRSLGTLNLRSFLEHNECSAATRLDIEGAIGRLRTRYPQA
jgi:hypothetical protein